MPDLKDFEKMGFFLKDGKLTKKNTSYNKYRNKKITVDGIKFDSKKESEYYGKLKLLKASGEIIDFKRQVKMSIEINLIHICSYILDFKVFYPNGKIDYVDVKGKDKISGKYITTDVFNLKKKMVQAYYNITIKMV